MAAQYALLDLEPALKPSLSQEIALLIDHLLSDLQIVFVLVDIAVRRVVVLVLEVLEALLLVQRGQQLSVADFHLHDVDREAGEFRYRLDVLALAEAFDLGVFAESRHAVGPKHL